MISGGGTILIFTGTFVATFVAMELFSYVVHRYVYHRVAWFIHESHHTPRTGAFEWNDIFPALFASITAPFVMYAVGVSGSPVLSAVSLGVTAYGLVYFVVHDLYVHRRVKRLRFRVPFLRTLKQAHALHHRFGGEPYGLLFFANARKMAVEKVDESDAV
jgi:beta-carotene 3-hydroxylase